MLQTCKHDTAKLIFQKVFQFFSRIIFSIFYLQIFKLLFLLISAFFGTVQYSHREHLKGLCVDQYSLCVDQYSLCAS